MLLATPVSAESADATCGEAAARALPAPAQAALARIDELGRRLLALRGYLRVRDLPVRWSWDEARIAAYAGSPEQAQAQADVKRVQDSFAAANPGHALRVNLQVRSLDVQLQKWNTNASVAAAAASLSGVAIDACKPEAAGAFAAWLRGWQPPTQVNLAAPGLSAHGQGHAFDFQVLKDGALVAGTDSRTAAADWVASGWAARLADAVKASGAPFTGPLQSPDEPWHYTYRPPQAKTP